MQSPSSGLVTVRHKRLYLLMVSAVFFFRSVVIWTQSTRREMPVPGESPSPPPPPRRPQSLVSVSGCLGTVPLTSLQRACLSDSVAVDTEAGPVTLAPSSQCVRKLPVDGCFVFSY